MAAIFELDENLMKSYPIFEAAPNVSYCTVHPADVCHLYDDDVMVSIGGARRAYQKTHSRVLLMTLASPTAGIVFWYC